MRLLLAFPFDCTHITLYGDSSISFVSLLDAPVLVRQGNGDQVAAHLEQFHLTSMEREFRQRLAEYKKEEDSAWVSSAPSSCLSTSTTCCSGLP